MALFIAGPVAGQVSGRLGSTVFAKNRYGSYIRQGTVPITSTTAFAIAAKARMTSATQAWQLLTAGQRLAWAQWGLANPTVNRLGQQIHLTGHAAFVGIYCRLTAGAFATITTPPMIPAPPPLITCTLTADLIIAGWELVYTVATLDTNDVLWMEAAVVDSAGINYIENLVRFIGVSGAAEASPYDNLTAIEARFGTLEVDNIVHLKVYVLNSLTGLLSAPLRCQATVVDTTV